MASLLPLNPESELPFFLLLFVVYHASWLPAFAAYGIARRMARADDDSVKPPVFVIYATILIYVLFLPFPLVYYDGIRNPGSLFKKTCCLADSGSIFVRERLYSVVSMISKVCLHIVVGFSVIGQSAVLDTVTVRNNRTRVRDPDDDGETTGRILGWSGAAIVLIISATFIVQRSGPTARDKLLRVHWLAAAVHLASATGILISAFVEDNVYLKRYSVDPDLDTFSLRPERWQLQCYNSTSRSLIPMRVSSCRGPDLIDVFSNQRRGNGGPINIAWAAFTFAAWSGLGHLYSAVTMRRNNKNPRFSHSQRARAEEQRMLTLLRWLDYLVSAPVMLLVINVIFGATNSAGVLASPLLLAALLVASGFVEYYRALPEDSGSARSILLKTFYPLSRPA